MGATLSNIYRGRKYAKNNIVLFQGEIPQYGFIVESGTIKVYAIDSEGNEKVVSVCSAGAIFPVDWLIGQSKSVMFYYETIEDATLLPVRKSDCDTDELQVLIHDYAQQEATGSLLRNLALQQSNASNKILYFFFYLAIRHGQEKTKGLFSLGIPLTHQFIADNLGLTRETVASEISKLKKSNVVMYRHKRYVVDKALLVRTVGREITSNFTS